MWQAFLMTVQATVVALWLYADYDADLTQGRPAMAIIMGGICAFGATQLLVWLKWLFVDRKRGAGSQ